MNRKSFFRLLGKGAAVLALAPSILASIPEKESEFESISFGGRTFHFKKGYSPFDGSKKNAFIMDEVGKTEQFTIKGHKYFYQRGIEEAVIRHKLAEERFMFNTFRPFKK